MARRTKSRRGGKRRTLKAGFLANLMQKAQTNVAAATQAVKKAVDPTATKLAAHPHVQAAKARVIAAKTATAAKVAQGRCAMARKALAQANATLATCPTPALAVKGGRKSRRKGRKVTKKGMRRKTARRAYKRRH